MTEISLDRIFVASAQRRVALTSETAGYLVLGVADALAGEGGKVTVGDLRLDSGGRVLVGHVTPCSRASTDEFLRSLLKAALDVAVCLRPALVHLAEQLSCRIESRNHAFARELETALIPVNRAAARRALARLHRDVTRLHGVPDKPERGLREPQSRHLRSEPAEALPGENRQQASAPPPQEGAAVQGKRTIYEMLSKRAAHLPSDVTGEGRFSSASASIQSGSDALARAANDGRAERGLPERTPESAEGNATDVELHRPERTLALPNVKRRSEPPAQVMIGSVSDLTLPASTGVDRCLLHDPEGPTPELPRAASSVEQTAALQMPAVPNAASKSGTDASLGATLERTLALPCRARQREDVDPLTGRCGSRSLDVASQHLSAPELAIIDSLDRTMALPIVTTSERFSVEESGDRAVTLSVEDAEQRPVFVEPIECTNLLPWLVRTAEPLARDASINVVASESDASINVVASESDASINVVALESAASTNVVGSESDASINVVGLESDASTNVVGLESDASTNVVASEKTKAALESAVAHRSRAMLESIEPTMRLPLCTAPREPLIATFEAHPSEAIESLSQAELESPASDGSMDYITYDPSGRNMVKSEFDAAQSMMGAGYAQIPLEKRAEAYGSPAIGLADAPNECDSLARLEVTMALPLVRRRLGPSLQMARGEPSDWERTSVDAVVEIEDNEIYYVEPSMELHVDEGGEFETESVEGEPTVSGLPHSDPNEARSATEHRQTPGGLEPQGLDPVESRPRLDELADVEEDEAATGVPTTHYGSRDGILLPTYSSIETLSDQFVAETLWSEAELSRRLRLAAGVETAEVLSRTPPPIATPSFESQSAAQLEPTRRLRRIGPALSAGAAVVVALCLYGNARHGASALVASSPHSDALAQICRGTVNVRGVEPEHRLQIRQTGEEHFREPTRIVGTTATFLGLTCGRDAELLIDDDRDGLRRIPIPGMRLQPLDAHSWAVTDLRLDGAT